ncbi:unnamed protein product [Ixodes pacificus]
MWYFVLKTCLEHRGFDGNTILAVTEDNLVLATMVNNAMLVITGKTPFSKLLELASHLRLWAITPYMQLREKAPHLQIREELPSADESCFSTLPLPMSCFCKTVFYIAHLDYATFFFFSFCTYRFATTLRMLAVFFPFRTRFS